MIDDEPRPVWMSPLITHWALVTVMINGFYWYTADGQILLIKIKRGRCYFPAYSITSRQTWDLP